jgi:hypothetical protein
MKRRGLERQRGNALVEGALLLPILLGAGLVLGDLYLVSRARADLERSTATLSTILASQTSLTAAGLDQLVNGVLADRSDRYELFVGQVWRNGKVAWSLPLGNAEELCENPLETSPYVGPLPERDESDESDTTAMLVVQACQESSALGLGTLVLDNEVLKTVAIDRMRTADLELDEDLRRRAGLPEEDEE